MASLFCDLTKENVGAEMSQMISIIDDDESVREATRGLVRSLGFDASAFASPEHFLRSNCIAETSCLITDIQMPGLSGVELQHLLLAQGHSTPIIFITALPEERMRTRVLDAGAVCLLSKPFSEECLINCLDIALKNHAGETIEQ
jgi:FixJ family two-component response regulator